MANAFYTSGAYASLHPSYHVEDSSWKAQKILQLLKKNNLPLRTITEIGCGAGEILHQLQHQLPAEIEFYGYDISPQAIALCQERENEKLHCFCEDLLTKEVAPADLLLCIDVFEHIEDYMGFLRALTGKATYKMFHIPLDITVQTVFRSKPILHGRDSLGHLHYFWKDTALATLRDTGYTILDWTYTYAGLERADYSFKRRLAKLPRQALNKMNPDFAVRLLGGASLLALAK
ncbi:MAG TPA: class I SAM-dependent methyltransferase [Phototrophicaceae bacterium]|nr:class I SAM-dependent methyltransferase [Phototrophicaceae bacterium]